MDRYGPQVDLGAAPTGVNQSGRFLWHRAACAPSERPVGVLEGAFFGVDGRAHSLTCSELLYNGWGEIGLVTLGSPEALPARLAITWFSLADDRFYSGKFELPLPLLLHLFETGFRHPATREHSTWDTLLVGLAPGGRLVLWVAGGGLTVEACHFLAPEVAIDWADVPASATGPREDWVRAGLERALGDEDRRRLSAEGPAGGRWDRYRQRWPWQPLLIGAAKNTEKPHAPNQPSLRVRGFNGESECTADLGADTRTPGVPTVAVAARSAPRTMVLRFTGADGVRRVAYVQFDEIEIFAAFSKLHQRAGASPQLALHLDVSDAAAGLRLYLCDDMYSLELLAAQVRVYRSS
jgi:Protein of unknown function (DUF2931)